jgi:hypothetical protein
MPATQVSTLSQGRWPTLAEDIEAEFGRTIPVLADRISKAQASALRVTFEQASSNLPGIMRSAFLANAGKRLKSHFGLELDEIPSDQYHEALRVASEFIADARARFSNLVLEFPDDDPRRWRLVCFDMAVVKNRDVA